MDRFFILCLCLFLFLHGLPNAESDEPKQLLSVTFLVAVNHTWNSCIATTKTPALIPGQPWNVSRIIHVGQCDEGPLVFNVTKNKENDMRVDLTFYSSVIEDASPPTCHIKWDGRYLVPTKAWSNESLIPGCFTAESREGYHMTYYWFYVIDWLFG